MINADEARTQQIAAIAAKEAELKSDADKRFKECITWMKNNYLGEKIIEQQIKWAAEARENKTVTNTIEGQMTDYVCKCSARTSNLWFLDKIENLYKEVDQISEEAKALLEKNGFVVNFLDKRAQYGNGDDTRVISYHNRLEIKW